jgi:hypothetical protein
MMTKTAAVSETRSATFAIRTRDYKVTFFAGDKIEVRDARGVVLASNVTREELEKVDPFLFAACRDALAKGGTYLDARLDRPASPPSREISR